MPPLTGAIILDRYMRKTLFTIGHSTHTLEHFVNLLTKHGVQAVGDVRSVPYSRRNPQFNREPLTKQLQATGIAYVFLGKELGARSNNPACYIDGKVQYKCLAEEPDFREGIRRLKKGIDTFQVALMCAERDPLTCHRTLLVCRELRSPDLEIEHILSDGAIETNIAAEKRLMAMMNLRPDMFHNERDCIEKAYEEQAKNIAYTVTARNRDAQHGDPQDENLHNRLHQ
jgi:uncharacterized protein (DUF488 family)